MSCFGGLDDRCTIKPEHKCPMCKENMCWRHTDFHTTLVTDGEKGPTCTKCADDLDRNKQCGCDSISTTFLECQECKSTTRCVFCIHYVAFLNYKKLCNDCYITSLENEYNKSQNFKLKTYDNLFQNRSMYIKFIRPFLVKILKTSQTKQNLFQTF